VAKSYNLLIPKELSVVGFDDNPINVYSPIGLTTVSQPLMEMGRIAVEKLDQIVQEKLKTPVKIFLGTQLIKRATCAKPERKNNNEKI